MKAIISLLTLLLLASSPAAGDERQIDSLINRAQLVVYANPTQSAYFSQQAIDLAGNASPNTLKARAMYVNGTAYKLLGDFDTGIKVLYDALGYCPPTTQHELQGEILMQISNIYCRLKEYTKSFEINDQATSISRIHNDSLLLADCYNNRGIIHYNLNEFRTAEQLFRQALQINRRFGNLKGVSANLNNMCLYQGNGEEKLAAIREAIVINQNLGATWALGENYNNMGKQYFYLRRYPEALQALAKGLEAANKSGGKELICDNYEYTSWVYAAVGDYAKAYSSLQNLYNMSMELQNNQKLRSVEEQLSEKRMLTLQRETAIREKEYQIALLRRDLAVLGIVLVACILLAIFLPRWIKRKKDLQLIETRYLLEQSEREVAELRIRQQNKELDNIQTELDGMRHELTGFAMFLHTRNELLDKIRGHLKEGYRMDPAAIQAHLKKVNAFIGQHQAGNTETNAMLLSIEEKNADFLKRLLEKHPDLTQGERYLATLLRIKLSTKEIALLTGNTPKTINMNRYRLRKSLSLQNDESITDYLQQI
jgi:tetratricopeptide (TPR) repeat protein